MARAMKLKPNGAFILDDQTGQANLFSTTHAQAIHTIVSAFPLRSRPITANDLKTPPTIEVINIDKSMTRPVTEEKLFGNLFSEPIKTLWVNDRYLTDEERICNRLGAYIKLAMQHGTLKGVVVETVRAEGKSKETEQQQAIIKLKHQFNTIIVEVKVRQKYSEVAHDRFIILTRTSGEKVRILIGKGLDFINPNGSAEPTYIIVENPMP